MMNWKGCGRRGSEPTFKVLSQYFAEGTEEKHEKSVGITSGELCGLIDVRMSRLYEVHSLMCGTATLGWCIQKITKYTLTTINSRWEATQRVMAAKLTRLTHEIAIQLHVVAESCTICSSRSRQPVRKLLDTPLYVQDAPETSDDFWNEITF
jgi:hypothetical protein